MAYRLVFVQRYDRKDQERFVRLEQKFIELERRAQNLAPARRFQPVLGREPTNTLFWEAEVDSMSAAVALMEAIEDNKEHSELLEEQVGYMKDYYVEIMKEL